MSMIEKLDWGRLEKLRAPNSISVALQHLGIFRIDLLRRELRSPDGERHWVAIPQWLKGNHPFYERLQKHEIGREILRQAQEEIREDCFRKQEAVVRNNSLGVTEMAVPLVLRGERIGLLMLSGSVTETPMPGDVVLEERFKVLMLSPKDRQTAIEEWRSLPYFNADKKAIVLQMLQLLAREVEQFFEESVAAKEREEAVHKHTFSQMVTAHTPLRNMLKRLPQIGESDSSVLVVGEPGTGRELLAQMIHERSNRKGAAFKTLHCSSVAENLLEAELLGYEKGAFLGAYQTKAGLFEMCKGGTLYLKEISDLSLAMQLKILRLIQDKTFSRLGSQEILRSDVRLIASTQRNLKKLVQMGAFREDLMMQLSVVELNIPPLRQRREDISILSEHFLHLFMKKMNKEGIQWKEDALLRLLSHGFPGNVRELRNEVERLVALKDSNSFIEVKDLSPRISDALSPVEEIEKGRTLKAIVDEYERNIIHEALGKYHWNKSRVAELFQITRQGLLKKISKHKLDKRKKI